MALLFCDSFDHYATAQLLQKWTVATNCVIVGGGRNGTSSLRMIAAGGTEEAIKLLPAPKTTLVVGTAFRTNIANLFRPIEFDDGPNGAQIYVELDTFGVLRVVHGSGAVLATAATNVAPNIYVYLELKATIHNTTGSFELRVNGATEAVGTNVDTQNTANAQVDRVRLRGSESGGVNPDWDDTYICDDLGGVNDTFLGDVRVQALLPNAVGASSQWTPSGGAVSNFTMVDEAAPNEDTDYNSSATPGQIDTYGFGDLTPTSGLIRGVQVLMRARKDDAGTRTIAPVVRHASVNHTGTNQNVSTSYAYFSQIYETNPGTGATWALTHVNAAEFGINEIA